MFELFNIVRDGHKSLSSPGSWLSAKRTIQPNIEKIVDYYQRYPQYVDSSHILIKILFAMNISRTVDVDRYLSYCKSRAPAVAQNLKLSSSYSKGNVFHGEFYGKGSKEILLSVDEWFDNYNSDRNWKSMQAVKVIQHCKSDLTGMIPDGRATSSEHGLAILSVNIPMLMVQYYHWSKEQDAIRDAGGVSQTQMQFIYSYVLTNMIYSHLDYALFNRMVKLSRMQPVGVSLLRHSFMIASVHGEVDKALLITDKFIRSQEMMDFYQKLLNVPTISAINFGDVADLPDVPATLQVFWLLILSRIDIIEYVMRTYTDPATMMNKELHAIRRLMKMNNVQLAIRSAIGSQMWESIEPKYKYILQA